MSCRRRAKRRSLGMLGLERDLASTTLRDQLEVGAIQTYNPSTSTGQVPLFHHYLECASRASIALTPVSSRSQDNRRVALLSHNNRPSLCAGSSCATLGRRFSSFPATTSHTSTPLSPLTFTFRYFRWTDHILSFIQLAAPAPTSASLWLDL